MPARRLKTGLALLAVLMVAGFLRLFRLDTFPPGLYSDVAANGLDALHQGFRVIYPRGAGNGVEGMIVWIDAVSIWLNGIRPMALYLTTVVIGLLTLPVHFALGARLFGRTVGLLSTALLAVSFWHVHFSRLGYRTLLLVLFLDLVFLTVVWSHAKGGTWRWALAGVVLGLGWYTYTSYRLVLLVLAVVALIELRQRKPLSGTRKDLTVYLAVGAVVAAPLVIATALDPEVLGRAAGVSVFAGPLTELPLRLWQHLVATVPMFNLWGDAERQYDIPHLPLFDPLSGLAFLWGLKVAWERRLETPYVLLLTWLAVFTLVVLLSDRTPHFLRASGLIPAAYLLAAIGLVDLLSRFPRQVAGTAAGAVVMFSLAWTAVFYFAVYPAVPGLYTEFLGDRVDLGRFISSSQWGGRSLYVTMNYRDHGVVLPDTFRTLSISFATTNRVAWSFLPESAVSQLPDAPLAVLLDGDDGLTLSALERRFPDGGVAYVLRLPHSHYDVFLQGTGAFHPSTVPPYSNW